MKLKVESELFDFEDADSVEHGGIRQLLQGLAVEGDTAFGADVVVPVVRATEDGTVYDIFLNGRSVGFNAMKAFCAAYGLKVPEVGDRDIDYVISRTGDYDG